MTTSPLQSQISEEIPEHTAGDPSGKWWARGIVIIYSFFALSTLSFVAFTFTQKVDLVAPNYYQMEVQYQDRIAQIQRARELSTPLHWFAEPEHQSIEILYPHEFLNRGDLNGTITLYRPSSPEHDVHIPIRPDVNGKQIISTAQLLKGYWKISVFWKSNGLEYFKESDLMI